MIRLNKFIAANSKYSRREADRLVGEGAVTVNGEVAVPGLKINENEDSVKVEGNLITPDKEISVLAFYKPQKILTAYGEGNGKQTLEEFPLFRKHRWAYSGRLDYDSEGLILFTDSGDLIQRMQKSEFKVEKEYIVDTNRELSEAEMEEFTKGMSTGRMKYLPCKIKKIAPTQYRITLIEGKKRQIRMMLGFLKVKVRRLLRIRIGTVVIGKMKPGEHKFLSNEEIKELMKCLGYE